MKDGLRPGCQLKECGKPTVDYIVVRGTKGYFEWREELPDPVADPGWVKLWLCLECFEGWKTRLFNLTDQEK